ncbi:MAG TPA: lipopolysaccharide heptosyltransferase II [Candidatus Limnocylindrales bacterium]|nr:lipopolysaccharide heptosyltransferase II [Candidatus Limnocylindrales bacterium]
MKILILKPSSLGDVVQALPVLRLLKRHLPASEIYWWIDSTLAPLLENDPDLSGIVGFERRRWAAPRHWPEMFRSVRWLRAQNFDWVIDLQCLARSGAFAWLANGKFLIGLDEVREGARGFYDLAVRRASFHTHAVDWYLAVLPQLGIPVHNHFQWLPERPQVAAEVKHKWLEPFRTPNSELRTPKWMAVQPGARWPNKRWPVEYFAELVRLLAQKFPAARFAVLGSKEDESLGGIIARVEPERCVNLCGQTSLLEMVEWLRLCDLMITNDTGPMHVAAALGKPLVALFGPTEPRRTGPYRRLDSVLRIDLPCSPCLRARCHYEKTNECLNAISPAMVCERVQKQFPL